MMILKERLYFPQIVYVSSLIFFSLLLFLSSILDFIVNLHKIIFIVGFWPWIILVIWQQLFLLIFFVVILFFIFLIKWIIWSLLIFLHQHRGKKKFWYLLLTWKIVVFFRCGYGGLWLRVLWGGTWGTRCWYRESVLRLKG